jgi:7-carboxy-7-deazaguanine synthase
VKINEIFFSIQGESSYAGLPCAFVRLTGCNLRCGYCDTKHAYEEGREQATEQVIEAVSRFPTKLVEVTGGEPLLQEETLSLVTAFTERGYKVLIETNGTVSLQGIDARATVVMDIKCPGSGMSGHMLWDNVDLLRPHDEVKFVLTDRDDYDWASGIIEERKLVGKHIVHLASAYSVLDPRLLASWILEDGLDARLQLQLHKYVWPNVERGV